MDDSGLTRLSHYLGFRHPKLALLLPFTFLAVGLSLAYFLPALDRHVPGGAPGTQIFLEIIWLSLMGFGLLGQKEKFRQKYGERAYQKLAIRFFLPAATLMVAGIFRSLWMEGAPLAGFPWPGRLSLGLYSLVVGLLLEIRGVGAMGIDRVLFVYTIFPEKGTQVENKLYHFLRHPLYAAMMHLCFGISLLKGSWQGLLCALIFALKLFVWSKFEEKELIERLGTGYLKYRHKVPAFLPRWNQLKPFWKTLLNV